MLRVNEKWGDSDKCKLSAQTLNITSSMYKDIERQKHVNIQPRKPKTGANFPVSLTFHQHFSASCLRSSVASVHIGLITDITWGPYITLIFWAGKEGLALSTPRIAPILQNLSGLEAGSSSCEAMHTLYCMYKKWVCHAILLCIEPFHWSMNVSCQFAVFLSLFVLQIDLKIRKSSFFPELQ